MRLIIYSILFTLILTFSVSLLTVDAQSIQDLSQNISASLSPEFPTANSSLEISIDSLKVNLDTSTIRWIVNGFVAKEGIGEKRISAKTGKSGELLLVEIIIATPDQKLLSKTLRILPSEVDILWESVGYTPPFFDGKSLHLTENQIVVEAFPNFVNSSGSKISVNSLLYTWKLNGGLLPRLSGYGRSSAIIAGNLFRPFEEIEVIVSTEDGSLISSKKITILKSKADVLLYEQHPLYGTLFNRALENRLRLNASEVILEAVPFYLGSKSRSNSTLDYLWSIDGERVENSSLGYEILLRPASEEGGSSKISLEVESKENFTQFGERTFVIDFNSQ